MTSPEALERLEELAKAATPGPWKACGTIYEHMNCEVRSGVKGEGQAIAQVWDTPNAFRDGQWIAAANPQAILELIDDHKAQAERLRVAEAAQEPFALLAPDELSAGANMNDPLSKWFSIAQLVRANEALSQRPAEENGK